MDILFNKEGFPLMMASTLFVGETSGTPSNEEVKRKSLLMPYDMNVDDYVLVGDMKVCQWGVNNDFPQLACGEIESTSVLNTGLKFLRNLTLGQGIFPCRVVGYDDNGNEVL